MANATFRPNLSGYRDVLDSDGVQSVVDAYADGIRDRATSMLAEDWVGPPKEDHFVSGEFGTRVGSTGRYVRSHTEHAKRSCAKNRTLTKAFNAETG